MGGWSYENREGEEEEEEEEDEQQGQYESSSDMIVLLIRAVPSMLEPDASGQVPVVTALRVAQKLLRYKVVGNSKDKVGVLFYGVDRAKDPSNEEADVVCENQVYVFQELGGPTAKRIRDLDNLCRQEEDEEGKSGSRVAEDLRLQWTSSSKAEGESSGSRLNGAIRACFRQFGQCKDSKDGDTVRIWLFTNEDQPSGTDPTSTINDCLAQRIGFELWYSSPSKEHPFDLSKFWGRVLKPSKEEEDDDLDEATTATLRDASKSLDRVMDEVRHQASVKRRYARMPLRIADTPPIRIQVALYKDIALRRLPAPVQLVASTSEKVITSTRLMDEEGSYVSAHAVKTGVAFGGANILITRDEFAQASSFGAGDAGMDLLGVLPASELRWELNISGPTFAYPDDSELKGSTAAFIALHAAMIARGCMALICYRRSPTAAPRLAVLLPQAETESTPPGLQLILVPWLDDIRRVPPELCVQAEEEQVEAARKVVEKLRPKAPLLSTEVPNPALQKHHAILESLALMVENEDTKAWDEARDDKTMPNEDAMIHVAGDDIDAFATSCGIGAEAEGGGGAKKRKAPTNSSSSSSSSGGGKKVKKEEGACDVDVEELVREGRLEGLTVADLKGIASQLGLTKGGKKADIIDRITSHMENSSNHNKKGGAAMDQDD